MDSYLLFHHAVKTNDVDLFAYALHDMSKIFFTTNHHNYARWMTRYALELLNVSDLLKSMLMNGGLSVRRTNNPYSRVGVDMALEQTINAEAKNRLKGIVAFADINTAVNRWIVTNSMRSQIVNKVLDIAGLSCDDESGVSNKETHPQRMARDTRDLNQMTQSVLDMLNPFDRNINKDVLFNIKTGKKASAEAEDYLLNVISRGETKRDSFIAECGEDPTRFERSITRSVIVNFATDSFIKKNKSTKAHKIVQLKGTRDLFARLLYLAIQKNISAESVLEYPLVPVPSELAHPDGSIRTTAKSAVVDIFEVDTAGPSAVDTVVVDGMFLLRNLTQPLPHNLRGLNRHILIKVMKMTSRRADLCFDTYKSPCIKDITRELRSDGYMEDDDDEIYTFGSGQKTPKNWSTLLKSSKYKNGFLRFFFSDVRNQEYADIIGNKMLYLSVDNECICLTNDDDGQMIVSECVELYGDHDEADTRVAFHAYHSEQHHPGNIVIRCNDTDVLIIMLANIIHFHASHVWLDVGLEYNNSRHYVDVHATSRSIEYVSALPGIYSYSGCDYIPSFMRKGKKRPIKTMLKKVTFVDVFSRLGDEELTEDDLATMEEFTCCLFGYPKLKHINEARYLYFQAKCKPKSTEKPLDCIKSVDPSLFPPCRSVLIQQIKRAWLISKLYKNAIVAEPLQGVSALDYGYELVDGSIHIKWFDGDQVPTMVEEEEEEEREKEGSDAESEEEETDNENEEDEEDDEEEGYDSEEDEEDGQQDEEEEEDDEGDDNEERDEEEEEDGAEEEEEEEEEQEEKEEGYDSDYHP